MKNFEMTQASPQENANAAWESLGNEMGFDHMTVRPNGKGNRFFSAEEIIIEKEEKTKLR